MKHIILTIVCAGIITPIFAQKSFYEQIKEQDTILSVYLEKDTNIIYRTADSLAIYHNVFLIFENKSSDSIILSSNFENFFGRFEYRSGILVNFYFNRKSEMPFWGELRPEFFNFSDGNTFILPHTKVKFEILLPFISDERERRRY